MNIDINLPGFDAAASLYASKNCNVELQTDLEEQVVPLQLGRCCQDCDSIMDEYSQCLQNTEDPNDCRGLYHAYSKCMQFCEWCPV